MAAFAGNCEWMDAGRGDMKHGTSIGEYKTNIFTTSRCTWQEEVEENWPRSRDETESTRKCSCMSQLEH
jgi:hypothetical protein